MTERTLDAHLKALLDAHRFGDVGRCVNSVAHDSNNALGVILAYADLIGMESGIEGNARRMLDEIIAATRRSSEQLGWLTDIARPASAGPVAIQPHDLVERAAAMRRYEAQRLGVKIESSIPDDLPQVSVEIPAVQRALIQLVINACDALADHEEKRIAISAEEADTCVNVLMLDTADPIAIDVAERMFEPFFTTKGDNHLGIGLSAAKRVAEANNGTLSYEPGRGFCLALPLA